MPAREPLLNPGPVELRRRGQVTPMLADRLEDVPFDPVQRVGSFGNRTVRTSVHAYANPADPRVADMTRSSPSLKGRHAADARASVAEGYGVRMTLPGMPHRAPPGRHKGSMVATSVRSQASHRLRMRVTSSPVSGNGPPGESQRSPLPRPTVRLHVALPPHRSVALAVSHGLRGYSWRSRWAYSSARPSCLSWRKSFSIWKRARGCSSLSFA